MSIAACLLSLYGLLTLTPMERPTPPVHDPLLPLVRELDRLSHRQPERIAPSARQIAIMYAKLGQGQRALELTQWIPQSELRAATYRAIALRLSSWNDLETSTLALELAFREARSSYDPSWRWQELAEWYAAAGHFPEARQLADRIPDPLRRAEALLTLARMNHAPPEEIQQLARPLLVYWQIPLPGEQLTRHDLGWRAEVAMLAGEDELGFTLLQQIADIPRQPLLCGSQESFYAKPLSALVEQGSGERAFDLLPRLPFEQPLSRSMVLTGIFRKQIELGQTEQVLQHLPPPDLDENKWVNPVLLELVQYELQHHSQAHARELAGRILTPADRFTADRLVIEALIRASEPAATQPLLADLRLLLQRLYEESPTAIPDHLERLAQVAQLYARLDQPAQARKLLNQIRTWEADPQQQALLFNSRQVLKEVVTVYLLLNEEQELHRLLDELWNWSFAQTVLQKRLRPGKVAVHGTFRTVTNQYVRIGRADIPLTRARDLEAGLIDSSLILEIVAEQQGYHGTHDQIPEWILNLPDETAQYRFLHDFLKARFSRQR